jgi:hypothetical protein
MKILCNGCSVTYGTGFSAEERQDKIWPSILGNRLGATSVTNVAWPGSSNHEIFLRTLRALDQTNYDMIVVQWSALQRHWFEPGLDRYYICAGNSNDFLEDWQYNDIYLSKSQRKNFYDTLTMLTGDYRASLDVALFCKTLISLRPNTQILFVNGLLPWTKEIIFPPKSPFDINKTFSNFTKDMLEVDTLGDHEILKWFYKLHNEIAPTIKNWVNIDNSWKKNMIDVATEGHHPGPKSHIWLADQIQNFLIDQKLPTVV